MKNHTPLEGACKQFEEDLVLHYYGDIADKERGRVEHHLVKCDPCRRFFADLQRLLPQITPAEDLPQTFWDSYYRETMAKLAEPDEQKNRWRSWFAPLRGWMMPAFGTVAAAVLVIGLMFGKDNLKLFVEPREEKIPQEIMADKNQLEFFNSMDILEALGNLEAQDEPKSDKPNGEVGRASGVGYVA